ncbi:FG-GAP-like repeat-containing protein [Actinomadura harenae]|nr:FG-GAP-like repeat-containing protein [Actinomadura harenae]
MRGFWKAGGVLSGALAAVVAWGTAASALADAGTTVTVMGYGEPWEDCVQTVTLIADRVEGRGRVYAFATTKCESRHDFLVPTVALAGDQGKHGLEGKMKSCAWASYCQTDYVYLDEIAGVEYRAANSGYVGTDPFNWPLSAVPHARLMGIPQGSERHSTSGNESGSGRVRWADYNGDGRADYLSVNSNGSVNVRLNTDGHGGWQDLGQVRGPDSAVSADSSRARFADFNGDGRADYLHIDQDGGVTAELNNSDGPGGWQKLGRVLAPATSPDWFTTNPALVRFADLDGDGRTDYNVLHPDNGSFHTSINQGGGVSGLGWNPGQVGLMPGVGPGPASGVRLADMDGDRRFDYNIPGHTFHAGSGGVLTTYINSWDFTNWAILPQTMLTRYTDAGTVALADITGDGRADYLGTNPDGSVHAYRNEGGVPSDPYDPSSPVTPGTWTDMGNIISGN